MGNSFKKGSANDLARRVTFEEGLEREMSIAQVKEVIKIVRRVILETSGSDIYRLYKMGFK
jgi:hypothetical protein